MRDAMQRAWLSMILSGELSLIEDKLVAVENMLNPCAHVKVRQYYQSKHVTTKKLSIYRTIEYLCTFGQRRDRY